MDTRRGRQIERRDTYGAAAVNDNYYSFDVIATFRFGVSFSRFEGGKTIAALVLPATGKRWVHLVASVLLQRRTSSVLRRAITAAAAVQQVQRHCNLRLNGLSNPLSAVVSQSVRN